MNDPDVEARGGVGGGGAGAGAGDVAVAVAVPGAANATAVPPIVVTVTSFRTAMRELESISARKDTVERLIVRGHRPGEARDFRRFVDLLGRRNDDLLVIRNLEFSIPCWRLPEDDMERLFGQVLPFHPSIRSISLERTGRASKYVRLLTESIPPAATTTTGTRTKTPLRKLIVIYPPVRDQTVEAIATMLDRNVALEELVVNLDSPDGRRLCQAVATNPNLRTFKIVVDQVEADTLDTVASSSSSLRELLVRGHFPTVEGVANLANQLRTNTNLTHLTLINRSPTGQPRRVSDSELLQPLLNVLETDNYTLRTVTDNVRTSRWGRQPQLAELLRRNDRIHRALTRLGPVNYCVEPIELAPNVLGMVSPFPTLLYRFIRFGNVNRWLEAAQPANGGGGRKRGHPSGND